MQKRSSYDIYASRQIFRSPLNNAGLSYRSIYCLFSMISPTPRSFVPSAFVERALSEREASQFERKGDSKRETLPSGKKASHCTTGPHLKSCFAVDTYKAFHGEWSPLRHLGRNSDLKPLRRLRSDSAIHLPSPALAQIALNCVGGPISYHFSYAAEILRRDPFFRALRHRITLQGPCFHDVIRSVLCLEVCLQS